MAKSLIIVESPAKAKTLKKYLGPNFSVKASVGHVKDLPAKRLGIDIDKDFAPEYVTIRGKGKVLQELRAEAKKADQIYLAPDPDREGEAIAWHIANELKSADKSQIYRVMLHEITQKGVTEALRQPGRIDEDKVAAQQARRLLDRLVGYKISPLLWKKVQRNLSAGRVQSVALRIICERDQEITDFDSEEYWTLDANLRAAEPPQFRSRLFAIEGEKAKISTEAEIQRIVDDLQDSTYTVADVKKSKRRRNPSPPFITSTLQQDAARKLNFSARRTMRVAQQLYEGLAVGDEGEVGLITYMRTDSTRISDEAVQEAHRFITETYGPTYVVSKPRKFKNQKAAQDAHEAIRPTSVPRTPEQMADYLNDEQLSLYTLIWKRFVASQMSSAEFDHTTVDIDARQYRFRATGSIMRFAGFTTLYEEATAEAPVQDTDAEGKNNLLPSLRKGEVVALEELLPKQHFTQPPPRFTEASLVHELERLGIGRPSTYASILSTLRDRHYVDDSERKFVPTELGTMVNELLVQCFPDILNVSFTADLEDKLDKIEGGEYNWVETLQNFYDPFVVDLQNAAETMRDVKKEFEETDEVCDKCGKLMIIRWGRFGRFMACSGFPDCKNTRELPTPKENGEEAKPAPSVDVKCDVCGKPMALKRGRFGEFLACTGFPECKSTKPVAVEMDCPLDGCGGQIVQRRSKRGRSFYGCTNYPTCTFSAWQRPVARTCPQCQSPYLLEKRPKQDPLGTLACPSKTCDFSEKMESEKADTASVA
jgi:DNA topoisomerase-1